jgi:hypothetical protein
VTSSPQTPGASSHGSRAEILAARDRADGHERLGELAGLFAEAGIREQRRWFGGRRLVLDADQYDDDYDEADGDEADEPDGDAEALGRRAALTVVPGYIAPDPNWRASASPHERAYWDRFAAAEPPQPTGGCERCRAAGVIQAPAPVMRLRYNGLREWDVCEACARDMANRGAGTRVELVRRYSGGRAAIAPWAIRRAIGGGP